ncbi:Uncharacterised protein [Niallia circulans]|nr:Uncharacterised protein [Niallia circulans]
MTTEYNWKEGRISIHALTKSATSLLQKRQAPHNISIHALTKSATATFTHFPENKQPKTFDFASISYHSTANKITLLHFCTY